MTSLSPHFYHAACGFRHQCSWAPAVEGIFLAIIIATTIPPQNAISQEQNPIKNSLIYLTGPHKKCKPFGTLLFHGDVINRLAEHCKGLIPCLHEHGNIASAPMYGNAKDKQTQQVSPPKADSAGK